MSAVKPGIASTTTSHFQVKPDYYKSAEECSAKEKVNPNTNPRHRFFNQTHFTAGDPDQFEEYRDATNGRICIPDIDLSQNRFKDVPRQKALDWVKYESLDATAVDNTFNYMFHKFKKGIFIKIKEGKFHVFLPFSKKNFVNEWASKIQIDPKYGDLYGFIRHVTTLSGYRFFPKNINRFTDSWYSNNCLVRYEFPIHEGDTNNPNTSDMFRTLCEERKVPDIEFFVNRRDFPMIKTDSTEAYTHLFGTSQQPLLSHNYSKYAPILSMVASSDYADIPIPTGDDWSRVCRKEGKFFSHSCGRSFTMENVPWEQRKPIAVFRGASTGCGVTVETNPRLKLAYISKHTPRDDDGNPLLDAGITEWNLRPRKLKGEKYLKTIDIKNIGFELVPRMSPQDQAKYKYLVNVDGHVAAYRLSLELESGTCILLANSKYRLWYRDMLKPFVHYVPVKHDLSDLIEKIKWCKNNDDKCKKISENAMEFAKTYLTKDGILDYLQKLLFDLKKVNGIYLYNSISLQNLQELNESKILQENMFFPKTNKDIKDIQIIPSQSRSFSLLKGVEWIVNMVLSKNSISVAKIGRELFNNKNTTVTELTLAGYNMVRKTSKKSTTHETFVTTQGTNELLKIIPNFAYTFGQYSDKDGNHILMENIQGQTFNDYIKSQEFTMSNYLFILLQLGLALHNAQQICGLVHWDLAPWNIILQKLPEPTTFDYIIEYNNNVQILRSHPQIVPIIIDMGRSHIIHENIHYGTINPFAMSTIQDILTILVTSIYEVASREDLSSENVKHLVKLANFISGTGYRPQPFVESGKGGLGDVRYFFNKAKKYSELISSKKFDLEKKTPKDFVAYIMKNFPFNFPISRTNSFEYRMDRGNARQVFEYALSKTLEEKALSFEQVFRRVEKCTLPSPRNLFLAYYAVQSLMNNLISVKDFMITFLDKAGLKKQKYETSYNSAVAKIEQKYLDVLSSGKETEITYEIPKLPLLLYDEQTFLFPIKIKKLLDYTKNIEDDFIDLTLYKDIVMNIMAERNTKYSLRDDVREYYENNFDILLKTDTLQVKTSIANFYTLKTIAKQIAQKDLDDLKQKIATEEEHGNCDEAAGYLTYYEQIIRI